ITTVDIWPPARPCPGASLRVMREYDSNAAWSGVTVLSQESLPADNPNHLRITFQRNTDYALRFGDNGEVENPDATLTYFNAYRAWWDPAGVFCPSVGGPGSGPAPTPGGTCAATGKGDMSNAALVAGAIALLGGLARRQNRRRLLAGHANGR